MSLKEQIDADIKKAMIERNKEELEALRSIKSLISLAETEKGRTGALDSDEEMKLLMKAAKQRRESSEIFEQQGRHDLAQRELAQLRVIERFLPSQLSEAELTKALEEILNETGAQGPGDMGKVMGLATRRLAGQADGKAISSIVKKLLGA